MIKSTAILSDSVRLTPPVRHKINEALIHAGFDGNGDFATMTAAISKLIDVLAQFHVEMVSVPASDLFLGQHGQRFVEVMWDDGREIPNTRLTIQYYNKSDVPEMVTDYKYECIVYLS